MPKLILTVAYHPFTDEAGQRITSRSRKVRALMRYKMDRRDPSPKLVFIEPLEAWSIDESDPAEPEGTMFEFHSKELGTLPAHIGELIRAETWRAYYDDTFLRALIDGAIRMDAAKRLRKQTDHILLPRPSAN